MLALTFLAAVLLSGCGETFTEVAKSMDADRNNPNAYPVANQAVIQNKGLEGCVYQRVVPTNTVPTLHVIRCPNSSTTTRWQSGKTTQSVSVIEEGSPVAAGQPPNK